MRRVCRSGPRGSGSGSVSPIVQPHFRLVGDDAIFSGGSLVSWTAVTGGQTWTPFNLALAPSDAGPLANGHQGVLFPTAGARIDSTNALRSGTHVLFAWLQVSDQDDSRTLGDRAYKHYVYNLSPSSSNHALFANTDNFQPPPTPPWNSVGVYLGSGPGWVIPSPPYTPPPRLHVRGYRLLSDGTLEFWINDTLVYSVVITLPTAIAWGASSIGASYQDPGNEALNTQWTRETMYEIVGWVGTLPDDTQWNAEISSLMAKYNVTTPSWLPTTVLSCRDWFSSNLKQGPSAAYFSSELGQWLNNYQETNNLQQGTATTYPVDPGPTQRLNGRPTVRFDGSNDFLAFVSPLSSNVSTTAYEYRMILRIRNVTQTGTTPYLLQCAWGDNSGFFWAAVRRDVSVPTTLEMYCGHWDGAAKSAIVSVPYDTWFALHVWYDGTNIRAQVNDGPIVSTAAGAITNAGNAHRLGRSSNNLYLDHDMPERMCFNASLSTSDRNASASYLAARFALNVG